MRFPLLLVKLALSIAIVCSSVAFAHCLGIVAPTN
jgi:hypothetical protein